MAWVSSTAHSIRSWVASLAWLFVRSPWHPSFCIYVYLLLSDKIFKIFEIFNNQEYNISQTCFWTKTMIMDVHHQHVSDLQDVWCESIYVYLLLSDKIFWWTTLILRNPISVKHIIVQLMDVHDQHVSDLQDVWCERENWNQGRIESTYLDACWYRLLLFTDSFSQLWLFSVPITAEQRCKIGWYKNKNLDQEKKDSNISLTHRIHHVGS